MSKRAIGLGNVVLAWTAVGLVLGGLGCECEGEPPLGRIQPQIKVYDPRVGDDAITELDFGNVPLGAVATLAVGVNNSGTDVLKICLADTTTTDCTEPTRIQPENSGFTFRFENAAIDTGAWLVEKGSDREFSITAIAGQEGPLTATLLIMHNAMQKTTSITLKANGVAPQVNFNPGDILDFGPVTVNQRKDLDLTLTNGTEFVQPFSIAPIQQGSLIFGMTDASGVAVAFDQPLTGQIPGNGSATIKVWFQPPLEGPHQNTITVNFCATCNQVIQLTGTGVKPLFELVPSALDFGSVPEQTPTLRNFVARNVGNVPLTVYSVATESGTTNEFNPTPSRPLPLVLQPTEELNVDVTYVGVTPGEDSGRIEVVTDAWDDPGTPETDTTKFVSVTARSNGPDIDAFPPIINFGTVAIGGNTTRPASLQNVGNAPLTVSSIVLQSPTAEITMIGAPGGATVIQPGTSVDFQLSYSPLDAGADMAQIIVVSDDRDEGNLVIPVNGIGGVPTTCSINVAPSQLTFGLVERGRTATLPIEIRNGGAQPCSITNLALNGGAEFVMTAGAAPLVTVAPGSSHRVSVAYAPTQYGSHMTLLTFTSDDPGQASVMVPISGTSAPSEVLVIPSQLDFNVVPVTCRSPNRTVTVYNTGSSAVTINNVYLDPTTSPEFELTPFATPAALPAGAQAVINLRYHPADIGVDTGVLFISHTGAAVPVAVPLSGEGQISPTVTDTFSQVPTPQADVLFIVDNSGSMSEEQSSLSANLSQFLSYAQANSIDYQIAVTTTDIQSNAEAGRFVSGPLGQINGTPRIITPQTPNGLNLFQQFVNQGTNGSGTERGLEAAYLALSDPLINTHNAGFLRTDAALAIIFVSDEADFSSQQAQFYENFFRNIKGFQNSSMFSASAVVGTQQPFCNGPGGNADYGAQYISVANNTGGVVESICSANWGQTLSNIGLNSFGLRRSFQLSSQPVPVTISVQVNGTPIPGTSPTGTMNWSYDMGTNSVVFTQGSTPAAGATISVTYTVACLP